jgi:ribosomal protein L7/L12
MGLFGGSSSHDDLLRLEARVSALEATVARLAAGLPAPGALETLSGEPSAETWTPEARALKDSGQVIAAIKLVRERTGWGLKEAKDYVDRL